MQWRSGSATAHVYDVRKRMYRGLTDGIEDVFYPGRAELYSLMPYEVRDISMSFLIDPGAVTVTGRVVPHDASSELTAHVFHMVMIPKES